MAKISIPTLTVALGLATGALAQTDGVGAGVTSSPPNVSQIPPSFFGPFHSNMPIAFGPGPADSGLAPSGGSGAGTAAGANAPAMAGVPWAFARGGGVGLAQQPATTLPAATTAQPAATAARPATPMMFRRFGR